ncbi:DUF4192 domain-containing protein [Nocardia panacis]|nr:DUF4192 domain-containing protein [Nocardia panacis]
MAHTLTDPGALIAALPAIFGFTPVRSLIFAGMAASDQPGMLKVDWALRVGLDELGPATTDPLPQSRVRFCESTGSRVLVLVVVDDRLAIGDGPRFTDRHKQFRRTAAAVEAQFAVHRITVRAAFDCQAITVGAPWWSLLGPQRHGTMPDPTDSAIAMERVLYGQPLHRSRDELVALVAPDPEIHDQMAQLLPSARRAYQTAAVGRADDHHRETIEWISGCFQTADRGGEIPLHDLAMVTAALCDDLVFNTMLAVAATRNARAAESLWALLARALPAPFRAVPASLLAFSTYLRGYGVLTAISLDIALDAVPNDPFALEIARALDSAVHPSELLACAHHGAEIAATFGVHIEVTDPMHANDQ